MLDEARKREKVANAFLAATMALSAAQSPKDFVKTGKVESPGVALMQRWAKVRSKAEKNLDSGVVVPRNKKMKTFKEFVEEAYLLEMRKEDKVKGKKKTPLYIEKTHKKVEPAPEGSGKKWQRTDTTIRKGNPVAMVGRQRQGMSSLPGEPNYTHYMSDRKFRVPQPHGTGGEQRGKKKVPGKKTTERNWITDGPSPAKKVEQQRASRREAGKDILGYKRGY